MKKFITISICLFLAFSSFAQSSTALQELFWTQMANTCSEGLEWEKSIEEAGTKESKTFLLDCQKGIMQEGTNSLPMDLEEFSYLFEYHFDNPKYQGWMDLSNAEGSVTAKTKPEYQAKCPLRSQSFLLEQGKLKEASAHIFRSTALYDLDIEIKVFFDASGRYSHHSLQTKSDVLWGGGLETKIEGRLLP